jgi:hydroxyethylthiazole kinase-like uncharacterized protein yjeF
MELLTAAQMRAIEQAAIEIGEVTSLELMERAGQGVVDAAFEEWPDLAKTSCSAVVLCGPGNNGGDGFVVARLLKDRGWDLSIALSGTPAALRGDAVVMFEQLNVSEAALMPYEATALEHRFVQPGQVLLVDGLLGVGQTRATHDILRPYEKAWNAYSNLSPKNSIHTVSIDVPTGYNSDTGALLTDGPFEPDLTVTFHREKPVHPILREHGYKVVVKDIGL